MNKNLSILLFIWLIIGRFIYGASEEIRIVCENATATMLAVIALYYAKNELSTHLFNISFVITFAVLYKSLIDVFMPPTSYGVIIALLSSFTTFYIAFKHTYSWNGLV